ncbi:GerAB/ArcD/ProY family transporter [Paenibacillus sp. strain BS8-2]
MNKTTISHIQIGVLFFVFMTGSSIINIPGPLIARAGNAAWLSLLISGGAGFLLLAMILFLYRRYPELSYIEFSRKLIGDFPTIVLGLLSLTFLFQMLAAMVMDVGIFMVSSMLRETPIYMFTSMILLVSALTARAGIEVMARMFVFIVMVTGLFLIATFLLATTDYVPEQLLPIFPNGIKPVLHGAYFSFGFPYAEVFVIGLLMHHTAAKNRKQLPATLMIALGLNVFILCAASVAALMMFGIYAGDIPYVLYAMARIVEFQEIIQRIESIIGMSLILGSYMKSTVTLYAISLVISKLFKMDDYAPVVMPVALLTFFMGLVTFEGPAGWGAIVTAVHPLWAAIVFVVPLLVLTVAAAIRKQPNC